MTGQCACGCGGVVAPGKRLLRGHWSRSPEARAMYDARRSTKAGPNSSGLCQCGCGKPTPLASCTSPDKGWVIGQPIRFLPGHHLRGRRGADTSNWRGGRYVQAAGYVFVMAPDHPAANKDGYVWEHRLVAEKTLGRYLEKGERVHHINGIKGDNRPENLVVMKSQADHMRQHSDVAERARAWNVANPNHAAEAGRKGAAARWKRGVIAW